MVTYVSTSAPNASSYVFPTPNKAYRGQLIVDDVELEGALDRNLFIIPSEDDRVLVQHQHPTSLRHPAVLHIVQ
jgi:hypothetical protein